MSDDKADPRDAYAVAAVKRVKLSISKGAPRASRATQGNRSTYRNFCEGMKQLQNLSWRQCTRKPTEIRVWANTVLHFCPAHVELWDDTVTKALRGWEDEVTEDSVQVKEAAT